MPLRAVELLKSRVGSLNGKKIAILGVSYRPGVKETAFSGSLDLLQILNSEGAEVYGVDPLFSEDELESLGFRKNIKVSEVEILILHTAHAQFLKLDFSQFTNLKYILDGRNFISSLSSLEKVEMIKF
jgi:UDP-N-acetyl-D-mannosaminuronate dehydrogenase